MNNLYRVAYIKWANDVLQSSGEKNQLSRNVVALTQKEAATKLRKTIEEIIEIVSISNSGTIDVE